MAKKTKFLKNLLTTASTAAIVLGATSSAYAGAQVRTTNGAATAGDGQAVAHLVQGGNWAADSSLVVGLNHSIQGNGATLMISSLRTTAAPANPGIIANGQNVTVGSVVGTNDINASIATANTLELTGEIGAGNAADPNATVVNDYTRLGTVTFGNANAALRVNLTKGEKKITLKGAINGNGGNEGIIELANGTTTFGETIGATNTIGNITIASTAKGVFNKAVNTNAAVQLAGEGSEATFGGNVTGGVQFVAATTAGGKVIIKNGVEINTINNNSGADNKGEVEFEQNGTITAAVGATGALESITIGTDNQGTAEFRDDVKAAVINVDKDSTFKLASGVGGNKAIITTNGFQTLGAENTAVFEVADNKTYTFTGDIGKKDKAVKKIQFDDANAGLTVIGTGLWAKELASNDANAKGKLTVKGLAADGLFELSGDTTNVGLTKLTIDERGGAGGAGGTTLLTLKGKQKYTDVAFNGAVDHQLILSENATLESTNAVVFKNAAQELQLNEGSVFTAPSIDGNGGNEGIIRVKGNATLTSDIGTGGNPIDKLVFDTADKTLTSNKTAFTANNGVVFSATGTVFDLTKADQHITITGKLDTQGAGFGTVRANALVAGKTLTITNDIGDANDATKRLAVLEAKGGGSIELKGASIAIEKIDIGDKETTLVIGNNGVKDIFIGEVVADANKGTIQFNNGPNAATIRAGSKLGSEEKKLNLLNFQANSTLIVENGVNLHFANGLTNNAKNAVTLNFEGDAIVDASIGTTTSKFNAINVLGTTTVADSTKTVDFKKAVNVNGNIIIHNNATAKFRSSVTATEILGAAGDTGTLIFANTEQAEINTAIGKTISLASVSLEGKDLTFADEVHTKDLNFKSESEMTATFKKIGGLGTANFVTTADKKHGIILHEVLFTSGIVGGAIATPLTLNGKVGAADKQFSYVELRKEPAGNKRDAEVTVHTKDLFADLRTDTADGNKVIFDLADARAQNIGTAEKQFLETQFTAKTNVTGDVYSKNIIVQNATVDFAKSVNSTGGDMTVHNGTTSNFADGAVINASIKANAAGDGIVNFAGAAKVNKSIGSTNVSAINFNDDSGKEVALGADLSATTINFKKSKLAPSQSVKLSGNTTLDGTTVNLSGNVITFEGTASSFKGTPQVNIIFPEDGEVTDKFVVDGATSVLDLSTAAGMTVVVEDKSLLPTQEVSFVLIDKTNGATITNFGTDKVVDVKDNKNGFVSWVYDKDTNTLTRKNNSVNKVTEIVKSANDSTLTADAKLLAEITPVFMNDIAQMTDSNGGFDEAKAKEAIQRVTNPAVTPVEIQAGISNSHNRVVGGRILDTRVADAGTGVSAGDEHYLHGVWAMPFYSHAEQNTKSGMPGYKVDSYGVTVGADTQVNSDLTLGAAFTYAKIDAKHKGVISGDTTKGDSFIFSIYGAQQITDEWFVQGNATFGSTRFKNKQARLTSTGKQTASSRFDTTTMGAELLFGYNFKQDAVTVTPMIGAAFNRFNDGGYTETGTKFQNLIIKKKATNKLEGVAGASVQFAAMDMDSMTVTPEVHGFVRHDFLKKDQSVGIKLQGTNKDLTAKKAKSTATYFNAGLGVNVTQGEYEFGIGYDATFASKYVGHQGTVKVRLNF